jgi:FlaA1/EpsC-like NDP-sugar epimerase
MERRRMLLIGAGAPGVAVATALRARPELGFEPVGFVDDDPTRAGSGPLPVLGPTSELAALAHGHAAGCALITDALGPALRAIARRCASAGIVPMIAPGLDPAAIRAVAIEDLLAGPPAALDEAQITRSVRGQAVMVTGAGGTIGSELCRQLARFEPLRLILVERSEHALFELERELRYAHPALAIDARLADVCDAARLGQIFAAPSPPPAIVFHAAAYKHVALTEANPGEAIKNNIGGTRTVAALAIEAGTARFVLVSTDKAVRPASVMGATKRVAELLCQTHAARQTATRFITVRFGNVIGSSGSVIPIFHEQIARGGPVTVTDPRMTRYFMSITEAARRVLQAGATGRGGEVVILDMGEPVRILEVAEDMIQLARLRAGTDIEIVMSGARPGEKLSEQLSADDERQPPVDLVAIDELLAVADAADLDRPLAALAALVSGYARSSL